MSLKITRKEALKWIKEEADDDLLAEMYSRVFPEESIKVNESNTYLDGQDITMNFN